jgi:hypothetical protein
MYRSEKNVEEKENRFLSLVILASAFFPSL